MVDKGSWCSLRRGIQVDETGKLKGSDVVMQWIGKLICFYALVPRMGDDSSVEMESLL